MSGKTRCRELEYAEDTSTLAPSLLAAPDYCLTAVSATTERLEWISIIKHVRQGAMRSGVCNRTRTATEHDRGVLTLARRQETVFWLHNFAFRIISPSEISQ
jgi:hypothetical protein